MIKPDPSRDYAAPQHGPRPLPLFLAMLRSETLGRPEEFAAALAGLEAYQGAKRPHYAAADTAVQHAGRATLRDCGGAVDAQPVILVPSLINPPYILDLPGASLAQAMVARGLRPLLVDWGTPDAAAAAQDVGAHARDMLVPLIETIDPRPILVGYCLGGTIATAAAALTPVAGLATLAAPWRFAGYGEARAAMHDLWHHAEPGCAALGVVPMEVLQAGFWRLDPARTVAKYAAFGRMDPDSESARAFVRLEDWANAGAPLPYAVGRDLFDTFVRDDLPGRGAWRVGGTVIDPHALDCPTVEFVSLTDRIVPAATAAGLADRRDPTIGHVGMIVGTRAPAALWQPLLDWIDALPPPR